MSINGGKCSCLNLQPCIRTADAGVRGCDGSSVINVNSVSSCTAFDWLQGRSTSGFSRGPWPPRPPRDDDFSNIETEPQFDLDLERLDKRHIDQPYKWHPQKENSMDDNLTASAKALYRQDIAKKALLGARCTNHGCKVAPLHGASRLRSYCNLVLTDRPDVVTHLCIVNQSPLGTWAGMSASLMGGGEIHQFCPATRQPGSLEDPWIPFLFLDPTPPPTALLGNLMTSSWNFFFFCAIHRCIHRCIHRACCLQRTSLPSLANTPPAFATCS